MNAKHTPEPFRVKLESGSVSRPDGRAEAWYRIDGTITPEENLETLGRFIAKSLNGNRFDPLAGIENPAAALAMAREALQAFHDLREAWRSQDAEKTIDSIDYMDGLDKIDTRRALALLRKER